MVNTPEDLYTWTSGAPKAGLQVMVSAIGGRAIRTRFDIFERVQNERHPADPRFRIEHPRHIAPPGIPRFAKLNVIAGMQPYHAIDDGRWAEKTIGSERIKTTYAFRSVLDAHAKVAFGSNWFVAPPAPLEGGYTADAAYTRFTGKLAGFAKIDRDMTRVPAYEIRDAKIGLTVAGGKAVFEAQH